MVELRSISFVGQFVIAQNSSHRSSEYRLSERLMIGKDSGQEVLTNVTSEAEYHNYGKRPASEIRA
ncbi:MAG: hypothetical protein ACHBN1_30595 [Heteroscytonema crispum UTEX LB 1556]